MDHPFRHGSEKPKARSRIRKKNSGCSAIWVPFGRPLAKTNASSCFTCWMIKA